MDFPKKRKEGKKRFLNQVCEAQLISVVAAVLNSVRPPKKSWKKIYNLSGGEKTLSSLALVFALHHFKPTPLYFMDEIDAALDFKNVSIVACYIYVSWAFLNMIMNPDYNLLLNIMSTRHQLGQCFPDWRSGSRVTKVMHGGCSCRQRI